MRTSPENSQYLKFKNCHRGTDFHRDVSVFSVFLWQKVKRVGKYHQAVNGSANKRYQDSELYYFLIVFNLRQPVSQQKRLNDFGCKKKGYNESDQQHRVNANRENQVHIWVFIKKSAAADCGNIKAEKPNQQKKN